VHAQQVTERISFSFTEKPTDWSLPELAKGHGPPGYDLSYVTWLRQVHASQVVTVNSPGEHGGAIADGAVTNVVGAMLLVRTADCVPIGLWGHTTGGEPIVGVAHAGWQGLLSGICTSTVDAMRALGATEIRALIGPCIGPECYEFGPEPLDRLVSMFGKTVCALTIHQTPAVDMIECTRRAFDRVGVELSLSDQWSCTACDATRLYSHRARQDPQRLGLLAEIL
jgi:polyphenol oxidase